jgi:hypothetical protein
MGRWKTKAQYFYAHSRKAVAAKLNAAILNRSLGGIMSTGRGTVAELATDWLASISASVRARTL